MTSIRNLIFDVGNVLVRWSPSEIINLTFADPSQTEAWIQKIFQHEIWQQLNQGLISEAAAQQQYQALYSLSPEITARLFYYIKTTQIPIYQSQELVAQLAQAGYRIYALTDNVREIMVYLLQQYDFWHWFQAVVVSAETGMTKPHPAVFQYVLQQHHLQADETVFIDDHLPNIEAAAALGIHSIHFQQADSVAQQLRYLGVSC
ncbi:HAD family phosphatase [Vitreoscilla massiliensis]|uniref:HAD family phosphatase n=1 Tax=Vitreoscilla massiliensis TaxID=1689272 RepID=A0ABY4E7V5_9NEIS|nr:HAD family phosphatase [Vitreoscilla massiliensis]UOO90975.1 HAD family phosphatase [Vitreoscilla massiliensis]